MIGIIIFSTGAYAQTPSEFGYRLLPNKIVEQTEGILEIYSKGDVIPRHINNLIATTSDSSIIQVLGIEENNDEMTSIKIKALKTGTAKIALAAPGFFSQEFPITVYGNRHHQVQILVKATPSSFLIGGPNRGYVAVELADEDGFPTIASSDITISLSMSKIDVIKLKNKELVIKKGEYFAVGEFEVNKPDEISIYASSTSMETGSSKVTVTQSSQLLTVHLYVYPTKITNLAGSYAYAIVQLEDSAHVPVVAKDDIPVTLKVTSSDKSVVNTSEDYPGTVADKNLVIKRGSYWGYVTLGLRTAKPGTYTVSVSAKDTAVSGSTNLDIKTTQLFDDKSAKLDTLPILATGKEELVGVLHLEDSKGNPILANKELSIQVDSLDESSISVRNIIIHKGLGVALVFGNVGYTKSDTAKLRVLSGDNQEVTPTMFERTSKLVAEPLIPKVLVKTDYPIGLYQTLDNGALTYFPQDAQISNPPNEFIQIEPKNISKGQALIQVNAKSLKEGSSSVRVEAGNYVTSVSVDSLSSKPPQIQLDYAESIFGNLKSIFSIQLVNEQNLPVFADEDMELKLVSNDPSIIEVPESVIIKKGSYYTLFYANAKAIGKTELAILGINIPLSKFEVSVKNLTPQVTLSAQDYINPNDDFDVRVAAQYLNSPLKGMDVKWNIQGAVINNMDTVTDENGNAKVSLLAQDPTKVDVQVDISGGVFATVHTNKQINVNQPLAPAKTEATAKPVDSGIFGVNPLFIIVPVAAAVSGIILKKKDMLSGITEKISLGERISEVKERLSQMREK